MKTDRRDLWLLVLLTFVGSALRIADLTGRSLWLDEGFTLTRLAGSWRDIFQNVVVMQGIRTIDLHPPLYFAVLKAWSASMGDSEFALKLVSAFASILLIPATYAFGRRLFTRRVGLLAALIALMSPAYQWYGHEMRMYTVVPLLAALSNYSLYLALYPRKIVPKPWIAWIVLTAAALFTHYATLGLFGAQIMVACTVIAFRRPKVSRRDVALLVGIVLVIVCIGIFVGAGTDLALRVQQLVGRMSSPNMNIVPIDAIAKDMVNSALFGQNATDPTDGLITWFVAAVALIGLVLPVTFPDPDRGPRRTVRARFFLGLVGIFPMLFVFLVAFFIDNRPSFRYSIQVVPSLHVVLAYVFSLAIVEVMSLSRKLRIGGLGSRREWLLRSVGTGIGLIALLTVFVTQTFGLAFTFIHNNSWQDDWRGMAQYIKDSWQPGDIVFVTLFTPEDVLRTYLKGVPIEVTPVDLFLQRQGARQQLQSYQRVWYTNTGGGSLSPDNPTGQVLLSLHERERLGFPGQTNALQLILFDVKSPVVPSVPDTASLVKQTGPVSDNADVVAYDIRPGDPYNRYANMWLSLYWRRPNNTQDITGYSVSIRFMTSNQRVWSDWFMRARLEAAPRDWTTSNLYRADYVVPLSLGLPRQTYQLELSISKGEKAEVVRSIRQPLDQAQVDCCVRILGWPGPSYDLGGNLLWRAAGVPIAKAEFPITAMPGNLLPVVLTWKLDAPAASNWQTVLRLDGFTTGNVVSASIETGENGFPLAQWPIGEPVRDPQVLQVPLTVQPGWYRLSVERHFVKQGITNSTLLGLVEVRAYPHSPVADNVPVRVNAIVGDFRLLGYGVSQPITRNTVLEFHTYWRTETEPTRDGVIFLHLIEPNGKPGPQDDNPPERGARSTLTYRPGDGIDQIHRLVIPADASGGDYKLYAGIYDREGLVRWPARQNGSSASDDLIYMGTITVPRLPTPRAFVPAVINGQ